MIYKGRKLCLASVENIAERLKFERAIKEKEKLYFELAENAPVGILRCDNKGNILYVNNKLIEILGSPGEEETKKINLLTFPLLVEQGLSGKLEECLKNNEIGTYELEYTSKWGKRVWIRVHIKPEEEDGKVSGALIIVDDITEKKEMEKELYLLSITDALTGAYNRRYLLSKLEEEIERAKRYGEEFSIILFDIDNFKKINDCYGHIMGDEALRRVAKVVRERIRKLDVFGRWGGEEFVIVLPGTPVEKAAILAEDLRSNIADIVLPCNERITASFGVTEYEKGDTIDSLIKRADDLMYKSKNEGKNKVNYLKK
ncbi:putative diguanylate cyclase YdaM [Fervidicola ferrireducens]|uniref:Putative diguanylate cyclase YdaM n=1 Tax=Fervidicola ferrireducens TaxID=520764 RepID=A0A140LDV4_9FIRM|nr:sensor domain-containing diguanylate cyclase [Fervidicola ferrireducens]KXG78729.1 putative diguanylate cyclase YdaM [Fervidicola ferrireducens]